MEITGVKWREVISILYQIPFNLGHLTLPGFAYFIRDWHYLQLALSLPSVILISYYWLVPESPRWLFTVGRIDDASTVLEKSARMNKLPTENINRNLIAYKKSLTTDGSTQSKGNFYDLFRTPNMRTKTLCMSFNWFVCGLGFFGLAQYIGQAVGNIFTNVAISAVMGLPGTICCIYTMKRFGRKKSMIYANALVGISMLSIAFVPAEQTAAIIALSSIGIVGITVSFPTAYLYAGELFPTGELTAILRFCYLFSKRSMTVDSVGTEETPISLHNESKHRTNSKLKKLKKKCFNSCPKYRCWHYINGGQTWKYDCSICGKFIGDVSLATASHFRCCTIDWYVVVVLLAGNERCSVTGNVGRWRKFWEEKDNGS